MPQTPDIERKILGKDSPRGIGLYLIQMLVDEVEYLCGQAGACARLVIFENEVSKEQS
jgi:serine/threonine-protein kinase RsbW